MNLLLRVCSLVSLFLLSTVAFATNHNPLPSSATAIPTQDGLVSVTTLGNNQDINSLNFGESNTENVTQNLGRESGLLHPVKPLLFKSGTVPRFPNIPESTETDPAVLVFDSTNPANQVATITLGSSAFTGGIISNMMIHNEVLYFALDTIYSVPIGGLSTTSGVTNQGLEALPMRNFDAMGATGNPCADLRFALGAVFGLAMDKTGRYLIIANGVSLIALDTLTSNGCFFEPGAQQDTFDNMIIPNDTSAGSVTTIYTVKTASGGGNGPVTSNISLNPVTFDATNGDFVLQTPISVDVNLPGTLGFLGVNVGAPVDINTIPTNTNFFIYIATGLDNVLVVNPLAPGQNAQKINLCHPNATGPMQTSGVAVVERNGVVQYLLISGLNFEPFIITPEVFTQLSGLSTPPAPADCAVTVLNVPNGTNSAATLSSFGPVSIASPLSVVTCSIINCNKAPVKVEPPVPNFEIPEKDAPVDSQVFTQTLTLFNSNAAGGTTYNIDASVIFTDATLGDRFTISPATCTAAPQEKCTFDVGFKLTSADQTCTAYDAAVKAQAKGVENTDTNHTLNIPIDAYFGTFCPDRTPSPGGVGTGTGGSGTARLSGGGGAIHLYLLTLLGLLGSAIAIRKRMK